MSTDVSMLELFDLLNFDEVVAFDLTPSWWTLFSRTRYQKRMLEYYKLFRQKAALFVNLAVASGASSNDVDAIRARLRGINKDYKDLRTAYKLDESFHTKNKVFTRRVFASVVSPTLVISEFRKLDILTPIKEFVYETWPDDKQLRRIGIVYMDKSVKVLCGENLICNTLS